MDETGEKSFCVRFLTCENAKQLLQNGSYPQICGFDGNEPKVCCFGYAEERIQKPGDLARDGMLCIFIEAFACNILVNYSLHSAETTNRSYKSKS